MDKGFSFKNLIGKVIGHNAIMPFVSIFGIIVFIVVVGIISSRMYLHQMLFFEGIEKSTPMFTEEELREYGDIYKELSLSFQGEIGALTQGYAHTKTKNYVNRAGEKTYYGIYNHERPERKNDRIKTHNNGQIRVSVNEDGNPQYANQRVDIDIDSTYVDSDEYKNGINIKYLKTEGRYEGESNFQDILTVASMLLDQKQSKDDDKAQVKSKMKDLITYLFKMSHTYMANVSELYSCEKGCRCLYYYCNEDDFKYKNSGIDLTPFPINPHDEFPDYDMDTDYEIVGAESECEICEHAGKGCILSETRCYHGKKGELKFKDSLNEIEVEVEHLIVNSFSMGNNPPSEDVCSDPETHIEYKTEIQVTYEDGERVENEVQVPMYYYTCKGHEHWDCPGHFLICCMGHRDISIQVKIMYIDEMLDVIKNGYKEGDD